LDPKNQLQLGDLSGGRELKPEGLGEELSIASLPTLEGDTPMLLRDPFGGDDPTMTPMPAVERPGIDSIDVPPPPATAGPGRGCDGFACTGGDTIREATEDVRMWLADPMHREWLGDAVTIATMPIVFQDAMAVFGSRSLLGTGEAVSLWRDHFPGVQVRRFGDWWVKRVNPEAGGLMQAWGERSIRAQFEGLQSLGDMATPSYLRYSILFTRDVGPTLPDGYRLLNPIARDAYIEGSKRMGTWFNDIRPQNMGINGRIFDPAIDPVTKTLFWTGITGGAGAADGINR
ncbi:MAG: hypothetical protein ACREP8_11785, partial [Candidatus Binatia bacterium]